MEFLLEWLPRIGAALTMLIGLAGFFRPTVITDGCDITLGSAKALSESRAVFGGLLLGFGTTAIALDDPSVYLALGVAWGLATFARIYSMIADGSTIQDSVPPLAVDGSLAVLALMSQL